MAGGSRGKRAKKGKSPRAGSSDNEAQPQSAADETQQPQHQQGEADESEANQMQQQQQEEGGGQPSAPMESGGSDAKESSLTSAVQQTAEGAETQLVETDQEAEIATDTTAAAAAAAAAPDNQPPDAGAAASMLDTSAEQPQQRPQEESEELGAGGADESGAEAAGASMATAARSPHTKPAGGDEKQQDAAAPASVTAPMSAWETSTGERMTFGRKKSSGFSIGGSAGETKADEARTGASHPAQEQHKPLEIEERLQGLQGEMLDSYSSRGESDAAGEQGGEGAMEGAMHAQPPGQHSYAAAAEGPLGSTSAVDRFGRPPDSRAPFIQSRGRPARPPQRSAAPAAHAQQLPARPALASAPMQGMMMAQQAPPLTDMLSAPIQDLLEMTPLLAEFIDPQTGEMDANLQQALLSYDPSANYFSFDWNRQFSSVQEAREIQQSMAQEMEHTMQEIHQELVSEMDQHRDLVLQGSTAALEEFKRRMDERAEQLLVEESNELQMEAQLDEAQEEMQALSVPTAIVGGRRGRAEMAEVEDISMQ